MASEVGAVNAATPVAGAEPVATRAEQLPLPLPAARHGPQAAAAGVKADISTAAQLLSALLKHPALANLDAAPASPLLEAAEAQARPIAEALRNGISLSGLFYESHQAEWIAGRRQLDDLRQEPQARQAVQQDPDDTPLPALVRQQLDMLDGQALHWRGELWPGLPLQLSIARQPEHDGRQEEAAACAAEAADSPRWETRLVSLLPALGKVAVRLSLSGERIGIAVTSSGSERSALIAAEAASLGRALQSAGLHLNAFSSEHDDAA